MTKTNSETASRRGFLKTGFGVAAAAAGMAASSAQAQTKIAPAMVQYQQTPKGDQHCAVCAQWEPPNACKLIDGVINPNGWCAVFAPKA